MLARFFIDRPVFAWVISIVIVLVGLMAVVGLPVAQYPDITPPTIQVACQYPGANAQVVADTVAAPIEQQVNGVENMMYMSSQCNNDGSYSLTITFKLGVNLDTAQVLVQNRVALALPTLPDVIKATGVSVKKQSPSILLVVNLYSEIDPGSGRPYYDQLYLSNYATIQVKDALARVDGVGDVLQFGQQDYSMRLWLDPDRLASRNLTAGDVLKVLREQNVQVAAGQVGQPPVPSGLDFQYTMGARGRLVEAEQFANVVLKTGSDGEVTYLRDVGRAELGARSQDTRCRLDGKPSVGMAIFQLPTANALDTAQRVRARMRDLRERFPEHLEYAIVYDTTPFIRESVDEVVKTLVFAVILVAVVVLLFLQDWKAVLLPLIDVGVSLVGTFAVMKVMGFSLNNLTLFGLVLAIGIVVDDAIVVLENIERWLDKGLPVREATIKAMNEITGPIFVITLVLSCVFLPSAFLGGITGQFFRQFALTIAASMIISAVNAMTMTPARAAAIFKGRKHGAHGHEEGREALPWWIFGLGAGVASVWLLWPLVAPRVGLVGGEDAVGDPDSLKVTALTYGLYAALFAPGALVGGALGWLIIRPVNWLLGWFFRGFNQVFDLATRAYGRMVGWSLRLSAVVLLLYAGLLGLTVYGLIRVPGGFIPNQDKGYLIVNVQLPDSASLDRTVAVMDRIQRIAAETPGVSHTVDIPGISFVMNGNSSNFGTMFLTLAPFHERRAPELYSEAIANTIRMRLATEIESAQTLVFGAPAVDGLGNAGGFKLMLEGTGNVDPQQLEAQTANLCEKGGTQLHRPVQQLPRRHAAAVRGRGPRQVQDHEGRAERRVRHVAGLPRRVLRQRLQPLRPHLAGQRRGRRPLPAQRRDGAPVQGAQRQRRHGAVGLGGDGARRGRAGLPAALQHVHRDGHQRGYDAGRVVGPRHRHDGAAVQARAAAHHDLRVERADLHAEGGHADGVAARPDAEPVHGLRGGGGAGVFGAGGAVRELVAAAVGDPGGADVPLVRPGRRLPGGDGPEHLRAGRLRGAGRLG